MISRRCFLSASSALGAVCTLPSFSGAARGGETDPPRRLILIYLKGGNDGYNTLVPWADPRYIKLRPTLALKRDQLIRVTDRHGFHPALAALLPAWEANELAVIQGIGQQEITNQHYRDLEMQFTAANPDQFLSEGWLTRAQIGNKSLTALQHPSLDALAFGDLDIRVADPMGPFRGDQLRVVNMQHPSEWLARGNISTTQFLASKPGQASVATFKRPISAEATTLKTAFPANEFGEAMRAIVELNAARAAPPVIHVTLNAANGDHHDAFDTHWNQLKFHGQALERLASGLAALRNGLRETGAWENTLVVTYDEFGRCPKENETKGTHHGWASNQFAMGGKVKGGLIGEPVPVVDVFAIDGAPPTIDYRSLYTTIIEKWWGGTTRGVFDRTFKPVDLLRA